MTRRDHGDLVDARSCSRAPVSFLAGLLMACAGVYSCAGFRALRNDIAFMNETSIVSAWIDNADRFTPVYGVVIEWDRDRGKVSSLDATMVGALGVFAFFVKNPADQYVMAFSDRNANKRYDAGEPAWIHSDARGAPAPVPIDPGERRARLRGRLAESIGLPPEIVAASQEFMGARTAAEALTGWAVPIALGDIADLDDPRFSAKRGEEGMWRPAGFPLETGIGIYFLEPYDPGRIPVLFVYGIAGSPQDWRPFFSMMDRTRYQAWFYLYPTGRRLDEAGGALNRAVKVLHAHLGFERLHVVAHSMGGLVSRSFLIKNVLEDHNRYIDRFVSISTPWGGHEAAAMGVQFSPAVVPSWRDMVSGSEFQRSIFSKRLRGHVDHLLLYGTRASFSLVLPRENDGTVSVASQVAPAARADAVNIIGFDADHVGILSLPEVVHIAEAFLADELR